MMQLPIFEDLKLTVEQAKELAYYWRAVGNTIGVIEPNGFLTTSSGTWKRPMAVRAFKNLKEGLRNSSASWVIVKDNLIVVDFSKIRYNQEWIRTMLCNQQLGVADSEDGLKLFQKKESLGKSWYQDLAWCLKGVTVESLGLKNTKVVSLTHNPENPDYAEWGKLYFAA